MPEYHATLNKLGDACRAAGPGFAWVATLGGLGWSPRAVAGRAARAAWLARVLLRHVTLVFRCYARCTRRFILVREFATLPLACVAPALWPLRRKLRFVINHNLQWAAHRPMERRALRTLSRLGFRWVCFETDAAATLAPGALRADACWVVPMPVDPPCPARPAHPEGTPPAVGLVGLWRADKNLDGLLPVLGRLHREGRIRLLIGTPDRAACMADLHRLGLEDLPVGDTTTPDAYRRTLEACEVVVCNYDRAAYEHRPSGILADVAAARAAVLAPPWPVIRRQVSEPVPVGECFATPGELPEAIERAARRLRRGEYDFEAYAAARSVAALAARLSELAAREDA